MRFVAGSVKTNLRTIAEARFWVLDVGQWQFQVTRYTPTAAIRPAAERKHDANDIYTHDLDSVRSKYTTGPFSCNGCES